MKTQNLQKRIRLLKKLKDNDSQKAFGYWDAFRLSVFTNDRDNCNTCFTPLTGFFFWE